MDDIFDTRFEGVDVELDDNRVNLGDDINIIEQDPSLHRLMIGVGWDANAFAGDPFDLDISLLLLGSNGQTRIDEDFIFYNNEHALDGGIRHHGDNRLGAGEGDDEAISVDLHSVPFDVAQIVIVLSIYKGHEKGQGLGGVRKCYVRLVNESNNHEILRFELDEHMVNKTETAALIGAINREGPKWHFKPLMELDNGGLGAIAERHGMIIGAQ